MARSGFVLRAVKASRSPRRLRGVGGVALAVSLLLAAFAGAPAGAAPAPATGFAVHDFVTGLPTVAPSSVFSGIGPVGLSFDGADHLLVSDAVNLGLYSFGPSGSSAPTPLTTGNVQTGLAFAPNGELFAARYQAGDIVQIDPRSGAIIRDINPPGMTFPCVVSLATDPVSGDLFFGQPNSGGICSGNPAITRVENPTSAHPAFVTYSSAPGTYTDGLSFAPDGTLYAVQQGPSIACASRISGTRSPAPPTVTALACFPNFGIFAGIDAIALSARPRGEPTLFVAGPSGMVTRIDLSRTPPTLTSVATLPTTVQGMVVGPDRCLYATQSTNVEKLTNLDGSCSLTAASVLPTLRLRPRHPRSAPVGHTVTLIAKIANGPNRQGTPVTFTVVGANPATYILRADHSGVARLTYRGSHAGTDTVVATATIRSIDLASTPTIVTWQRLPAG